MKREPETGRGRPEHPGATSRATSRGRITDRPSGLRRVLGQRRRLHARPELARARRSSPSGAHGGETFRSKRTVALDTASHCHDPVRISEGAIEEVERVFEKSTSRPLFLCASVLLAATAHGGPPQCVPISDETICTARGSGGGGTAKSPTWCAYDCVGVEAPVEIELPPGMVRCPGSPMGKVKFKQIKDFPFSKKVRTPRVPKK